MPRKTRDHARERMLRRKRQMAAAIRGKPRVQIVYTSGARSEAKNIIIARTQAKAGRNPWRLTARNIKTISNDPTVRGLLNELMWGTIAALGPALRAVGGELVDQMQTNFGRRRFKPLSPAYAKRAKPGSILNRTGELKSALDYRIKPNG